ncbi:MAG: hypothetical protein O3A00_01985 [Planctomycetota bacterium]|nr:hypothetical protein [Planctomycetota bacterium]
MANKKEQKKKDRERRVAQKKHDADAKRHAQEKTTKEPARATLAKPNLSANAVPKTDYVPINKKSPFSQRRGG